MPDQNQTEFSTLTLEQQAERLQTLAVEALEKFGISSEAKLELIKYRENAVFGVEDPKTGDRFVIRVHRPGYQTEQTIRSEMQWMDALREADVYTPTPLAGIDGKKVQKVSVESVPQARLCSMLHWVDGIPLAEDNPTEAYHLLGQVNARFHRHIKTWKLPDGFQRQSWDENGMFGENPLWGHFKDLEALNKEQLDLMYQARAVVLNRLEKYGKGPDRFGLIHADLMAENILLHEGNPYVIDFDDSGFGWFMYDLATLVAVNIPDEDEARVAINAWVEGYRSVESLADEHLDELPTFLMCRYLVGLGWLHTRKETPLAQEYTGAIVEMACGLAESLIRENLGTKSPK
jgi:Ser/Thr protein kinase RdoA (MazF antagonist)